MTQNERREYLIRVLLSEVPQYSDMKIPDQEDGQKKASSESYEYPASPPDQ